MYLRRIGNVGTEVLAIGKRCAAVDVEVLHQRRGFQLLLLVAGYHLCPPQCALAEFGNAVLTIALIAFGEYNHVVDTLPGFVDGRIVEVRP